MTDTSNGVTQAAEIVVALLTFAGLFFAIVRYWRNSHEKRIEFETNTNLKIAEIDKEIVALKLSRQKDADTIERRLSQYHKEHQEAYQKLFENINSNQREFYSQLITTITNAKLGK